MCSGTFPGNEACCASGFLTRRCAMCRRASFLVLFLTLIPLSRAMAASAGTLTFERRVKYARAVERVLWRHRIWPKENRRRKPDFDDVVSVRFIRNTVEDVLKKSNAL